MSVIAFADESFDFTVESAELRENAQDHTRPLDMVFSMSGFSLAEGQEIQLTLIPQNHFGRIGATFSEKAGTLDYSRITHRLKASLKYTAFPDEKNTFLYATLNGRCRLLGFLPGSDPKTRTFSLRAQAPCLFASETKMGTGEDPPAPLEGGIAITELSAKIDESEWRRLGAKGTFDLVMLDEKFSPVGPPLCEAIPLEGAGVHCRARVPGGSPGMYYLMFQLRSAERTFFGAVPSIFAPPLKIFVTKPSEEQKRMLSFTPAPEAATGERVFDDQLQPYRSTMRIYSDGSGRYLAVADETFDLAKFDDVMGKTTAARRFTNPFFWGDGKTFTQLSAQYERYGYPVPRTWQLFSVVEDTRSTKQLGTFQRGQGVATLRCPGGREISLSELASDKADPIRRSARFQLVGRRLGPGWDAAEVPETNEVVFTTQPVLDQAFYSQRIYMGKRGHVEPLFVYDIDEQKDGGSMFYDTSKGTFYFPHRMDRNTKEQDSPTFMRNGTKIALRRIFPTPADYEGLLGPELVRAMAPIPIVSPCSAYESK